MGKKIWRRWIYGLAVIKDGKESTYTWSKEDFYIVDKPCDIINKDYPLNSISINKKIIDELIDDIVIDKNKNIRIIFKYEDKYFEALDFINKHKCDIISAS